MKLLFRSTLMLLLVHCMSHCAVSEQLSSGPGLPSGKGWSYWQLHSLIYAEVEEVGPSSAGPQWGSVVIHPLATLSGKFDCGKTSKISLDYVREHDFVTVPARVPVRGDKLLLVYSEYSDQGYGASYMPNRLAIEVVTGFSDPKVEQTLKAVQKLRDGEKEGHGDPRFARGDGAD